MSLSRANAEFMLIPRLGPIMTAAGMDGSTVDGSNLALNGPIGKAIRDLGYAVTSITEISDADVAQITEAQYDEFLDTATLHVMEAVLGNLDDVDIRVGPRSEKLNQLAEQVERKIKRLSESLVQNYGYGLATLETGVLTQGIAEHD